MGISSNKIRISNRPMICPAHIENPAEAGSIYLVIHRSKTNDKDDELQKIEKHAEKTSHFCLAVDITGSSNTDEFIATHYDLCVNSSTDLTTYINPSFKRRTWDDYHLVRKIGEIPLNEIKQFHLPWQFAFDLCNRLLQHVYSPLFSANNGPHWSSVLNCQTITRESIQFLGYQFPDDIQLITDIIPMMSDLYVNGSLITAQAREKSNEILPC